MIQLVWLTFLSMFPQMANITVTYRDGRVAQLEQVYIRGSKIRFLILPDMLKNAPMLKSMKNKNQASGAGRGKAAILKAQGTQRLSPCLLPGSLSLLKSCVMPLMYVIALPQHLFGCGTNINMLVRV